MLITVLEFRLKDLKKVRYTASTCSREWDKKLSAMTAPFTCRIRSLTCMGCQEGLKINYWKLCYLDCKLKI